MTSIAILCIAVALAGCTDTGKGPATPRPTAVRTDHLVVSEAQDNATVEVAVGTTITLSLPENPTTGFRWTLNVTPGLQVTKDDYTPSDTTGNLVGSGGTRSWDITAEKSGRQEITAIYNRSWEPLTGSEETFTMTVIVR